MKKAIKNIAKLGLATLVLSAVSCREDKPQDIHEHEEANKMVITYTEVGTTDTKEVIYNVGTGVSGKMNLVNGKSYKVAVSFFHDDENLTPEILEEVDEHFMQYEFANMQVNVQRSTDDSEKRTDGNYLGINSLWTVNSTPLALSQVKVKLLHQPENVDDAANNGGGASEGGEPDVVVSVDIE